MPVPRRRRSRAAKKRQRNHKKLSVVHTVECPHCKEQTLPHQVCTNCGQYKGTTYRVTVTK